MVVITPIQLKTANLIFAEHEMLLKKVPLLESKITNLETINSNWSQVDSLRSNQVTMYKETLAVKDKDLKRLNKSLKTAKYAASGSIITTIILALVCVLK